MDRVRTGALLALLLLAPAPPALAAQTAAPTGPCLGECDADRAVTAAEIALLVGVVLGLTASPDCGTGEGTTIADLVQAAGNRLNGCGPSGTITPSASPTPTHTPGGSGSDLDRDHILRIEFGSAPPFIESLPNVLYALLGQVERREPFRTIHGALFDGDALLGVSTSTNGCCAVGPYSFNPVPVTWRASGSPWDFPAGAPATVDFAALHDGSIDGRIDVWVDAGGFDLDLESVALRFIHATSANGGSTIPPAPIVRSVRIVPRLAGAPSPTAVASPTAPRSPIVSPSRTPTIPLTGDD